MLHKWLYLYISVVAHGRFVLLKTLCWLHQFYITCLIFFFFAVQFNENNRRIVLTRINQKTRFYTSLFHSRIYKRLFMKQYTETCNSNYIHPPLLPTKLWNLAHCTSNLDSSWKFRKWLGSATKQNTPNMPLEGKVPCRWPSLSIDPDLSFTPLCDWYRLTELAKQSLLSVNTCTNLDNYIVCSIYM